ncbi:MAG: tripartite tricarboxylate transporter substrate binding protein [Betaproteobacteria bacterium]
MLIPVRRLVAHLLATLMMLPAIAQGQDPAADYPNKPVKFLTAFPPGGGTDLLARLLATQLTRTMGQSFVVESRPGASGVSATQAVLSAAPDGYTILVGGSGPMVFNPIAFPELPYDANDLVPVTIIGSYPLVIAAKSALPVKTIADMIKVAKEKQGNMTYGSPGATFQVPMEHLNKLAGIRMTMVPFKGGGPAVQAVMAGDIDLFISDLASVASMQKSGKGQLLAVTTARRNPLLPDVPTVAESGISGFEASAFAALGAHRKVPPSIIRKLQQEVAKVLALPEMRDRFAQIGIDPGGMSPEDTAARIKREIDLYRPIAQGAGVRVGQ